MHAEIIQHVTNTIELTNEELEEFTSVLVEKKVKKKSFLIKPGDRVKEEYFVVKGCLLAYYIDHLGNKHILQFAVEDWWISDFESFFNGEPAKLYIEALEDCTLLAINKDVLETVYQRIPKFERFFRIKTTKAFVSLRTRILSSLQKTAKERYVEFCEAYPDIEKRIANYQVANYLGIKPESLSRIRKELVKVNTF
ncbi:cAMP-binding domain of CRP or a regulatory subunit of cAMP-dependent protein kinases [Mesonia phycicola]|uniref:cAMP-binding domain of CRP or a regulatory subunit of cAMP-dependent protein kinases n=1 Tax=Mesonia phycicola TaxID=579105 RepID=A0A1M6BM02_9FLAO|nr:Crp/Fnr family transcriptional regulator [Mesonia phycicola]SHI49755.1 cAMP-binding domain of CRP or a regulatory subunit of cAMP-dependent protein kinases [Mesonia phycicola]